MRAMGALGVSLGLWALGLWAALLAAVVTGCDRTPRPAFAQAPEPAAPSGSRRLLYEPVEQKILGEGDHARRLLRFAAPLPPDPQLLRAFLLLHRPDGEGPEWVRLDVAPLVRGWRRHPEAGENITIEARPAEESRLELYLR